MSVSLRIAAVSPAYRATLLFKDCDISRKSKAPPRTRQFQMEIRYRHPYTFEMLLSAVKKRWLVAPLAALFLIFSGGAAVAPDCHIVATNQTQDQSVATSTHSSHSHTHSHQSAATLPSKELEPLLTLGGTLSNEMCFIVGFIVLLLLRFVRGARSSFNQIRIARHLQLLPQLLTGHLGYLKLTHLTLGIIRI